MFSKVVTWMIARAMPPDIDDPHQEWLLAEAAEKAIRQTAGIALLVGLLVLGLLGAVGYRYVYVPARQLSAAPAVGSEALKQLGAENAKLTVENQELRKTIEGLTKERDGLQTLLADLEKQTPQFVKSPQPAAPPAAAPPPTAPAETPPPPKAAAHPRSASAPKPAPPVAAPEPRKPRATTTGRPPAESVTCGDGRRVPNAALCAPAAPPADELNLPQRYQCGDGSTAADPEACHPRSPNR